MTAFTVDSHNYALHGGYAVINKDLCMSGLLLADMSLNFTWILKPEYFRLVLFKLIKTY